MQKPIAIPKTAAEHQPLDTRAGELVGCCENSAEAAKLEAIADALDAFDAKAADQRFFSGSSADLLEFVY